MKVPTTLATVILGITCAILSSCASNRSQPSDYIDTTPSLTTARAIIQEVGQVEVKVLKEFPAEIWGKIYFNPQFKNPSSSSGSGLGTGITSTTSYYEYSEESSLSGGFKLYKVEYALQSTDGDILVVNDWLLGSVTLQENDVIIATLGEVSIRPKTYIALPKMLYSLTQPRPYVEPAPIITPSWPKI